MKILHISDLHLGKTMNEYPLVKEDQPYWIEKFLSLVDEKNADAVVISGDVYDRSNPSNEAVRLFDHLITELAKRKVTVLAVAGNHDSGQKLGFAGSILAQGGVHIAGVLENGIHKVSVKDGNETIHFWLVPYVFPQYVGDLLGDSDIRDYDTAFRRLLETQEIDFTLKNVIVAHQNVLHKGKEAERSGSESMVAGVGGIEYSVFDGFDYVALGHIHRAQCVGRDTIRYAGSPLCYHFDEAKYPEKGAVLVEFCESKKTPSVTFCPIEPLHKVEVIKGTYNEIMARTETYRNAYLKAEIADIEPTSEQCSTLRSIAESCGNIMMEIVCVKNFAGMRPIDGKSTENVSLMELFEDFYASKQEGAKPDEKERELISCLIEALNREDYSENETVDGIAEILVGNARRQEENE